MTVLVVSSGATALPLRNGRTFRTGYWLAELALPLERIIGSGHAVDVATPGGVPPSPDPRSLALLPGPERARQLAVLSKVEGMQRPLRLEALGGAGLGRYSALLVPGGHAQQADLPESSAMRRVLLHFHGHRLPTFMICHGPAALLSTAEPGRPFPYAGYAMTCFSSWMEHLLEFPLPVIQGRLLWYLDGRLAGLGARVRHAALPGMPFLIEDRELVTAQDPFSAQAFAERCAARLGRGDP
jgi:putative intracellular protease/amidase